MKRVLFLAMGLGSGGAERQMVTIATLLKKRGYDVSIACYLNRDYFAPVLAEEQIPIHWCVESNYLKRIYKIRKLIRSGGYDVVISFLSGANILNNLSAIGGKKWKVITGERSAKVESFQSIRSKMFSIFQYNTDKIVCNSNNAKGLWEKYYPKYSNKLITIYNSVRLSDISSKYIIRQNGKLKIIVAASYQMLKNPIGVVEAFKLLNDDAKLKVELHWYGGNDIGERVDVYNNASNLIEQYNLSEIIFLHGNTDKIHDKMKESDFVALFSSVEGLPNAICEGMTIGKPIIMSRVSDYSVLVEESNGFLCDWDNPESIKDAVMSAISLSNEEIIKMGGTSLRKSEELFSKDAVINKWIKLIEG